MSRKAVICIPSYRSADSTIFSETVPYLMSRGWHRPYGLGNGSHVGRNRNIMANHFLQDEQCKRFDWSFWSDDDMLFQRHAPIDLLVEAEREGRQVLNMLAVPGKPNIQSFAADLAEASLDEGDKRCIYLGPERGRHYRCHNIGMGVTAIHRDAFERLKRVAEYGVISDPRGEVPEKGWEFFPSGMAIGRKVMAPDDELPNSLGEDYGFSALCRLAGVPLYTTTRLRVFHLHDYPYSWEDAFREVSRAAGDNLKVYI